VTRMLIVRLIGLNILTLKLGFWYLGMRYRFSMIVRWAFSFKLTLNSRQKPICRTGSRFSNDSANHRERPARFALPSMCKVNRKDWLSVS
jgi:hypothetical protein